MKIEDKHILHKIIEFQSCIIQGRNINAMLHKDKKFYKEKTQADIITVYVKQGDNVTSEYVIEDHHIFKSLVEKYIFSNHNCLWNDFLKNCKKHSTSKVKYHHTKNLYELFGGFISKKKALEFSQELQLEDIVTIPIYDYNNRDEIAYICFMFQKKVEFKILQLEEVKSIFETLLRPLHDNQYNIFYTRCIRVDEDLKLLTEQEKRIVKKVLDGKSYPEIAEISNLSINTIKTHMKNIFSKYQVNSKIELYTKLTGHH